MPIALLALTASTACCAIMHDRTTHTVNDHNTTGQKWERSIMRSLLCFDWGDNLHFIRLTSQPTTSWGASTTCAKKKSFFSPPEALFDYRSPP